MDDPEHRQSPRISRPILVRYRRAGDLQHGWLMTPLHDLSVLGARFMSERAFIVGDALELQLVLPTSTQPVAMQGKVAWTKLARLELVELGVTFDAVDESTQQSIQAAVDHHLRKQEPEA